MRCTENDKLKKDNNIEHIEYPKDFQDTKNNRDCVICLENDRSVLTYPCGHYCFCLPCSKTLKKCSVCRCKITKIIRVFQ